MDKEEAIRILTYLKNRLALNLEVVVSEDIRKTMSDELAAYEMAINSLKS